MKRANLLRPEELSALREAYRSELAAPGNLEPTLALVVRDSLASPGSLIRAQLTYGLLNFGGCEQASRCALAVEYFHTASLLLDDLPCMDDAEERRGQPCSHLAHGEAATILGALGLINRAYAMLWEAQAHQSPENGIRVTRLVESCLGLNGILNGQAQDLNFSPGQERQAEQVLHIADGKTGSLLRLSLGLPAIMLGLPESACQQLDQLGLVWGRLYQLIDDFKDLLDSSEESGKTTRRDSQLNRPNYPLATGMVTAREQLGILQNQSASLVTELVDQAGIWPGLVRLDSYLHAQIQRVRATEFAQASHLALTPLAPAPRQAPVLRHFTPQHLRTAT